AISLVIGCNTNDFEVITLHLKNALRFTVADNSEGGNGVSDSVFNNLQEILKICYRIVQCRNCNDFCKKCVLLERTPSHIVENGLLNRVIVEQSLRGYFNDQ
ncbi:MAG: DUF1998 domain-containing protein, partial [Promethearchaeota archaeon]